VDKEDLKRFNCQSYQVFFPFINNTGLNKIIISRGSQMTRREKVELLMIALAIAASVLFRAHLPHRMATGDLVLCASVLLLIQGLLRDLWIKYAPRTDGELSPQPVPKRIICVCMESTVGVVGVIGGLTLIGAGISNTVVLESWFWTILVAGVTIFGFLIKDLILDWKTKSIRREKNHQSVIFW